MERSPAAQARYDATLAIVKQTNLDFVTKVLELLKEEGLVFVTNNRDGQEIAAGEYRGRYSAHGTVTVDGQMVDVSVEAEASHENSGFRYHNVLNGKSNVKVSVSYDRVYGATIKDAVKAANKAASELAAAIRNRAARKIREAAAAKAHDSFVPGVIALRNEFDLKYEWTTHPVKGKKAHALVEAKANGVAMRLELLTVEQARKVLAVLAE